VGAPHTCIYRGQVIPTNKRMEVEASITRVEGLTLTAQGFPVVDGLPMYEMKAGSGWLRSRDLLCAHLAPASASQATRCWER